MELERKAYGKLLAWKESSQGRSSLLIEGARRVGKSTIAEKFAREQYRSHILIDFAVAPKSVRDNFDDNLHGLDKFFQLLQLEYSTRLYPRESVVIFDEVQKFPKAREAIKYLVADGRYDFIETGSLISIRGSVSPFAYRVHRFLKGGLEPASRPGIFPANPLRIGASPGALFCIRKQGG